jgi:hypothetical protein
VTPAPVVRAAKPAVRPHPKPKRVRHKPRANHTVAVPKIAAPRVLGAIDVRRVVERKAGDSFDIGGFVILWLLAVAIACLAVAVIPPRVVPWRPAAIFVADRQLDLTLIGFALLATVATTLFTGRWH